MEGPPCLPIAILGVPFDHVTTPGALQRIEEMIASRRPHYVVTANVDFVVQAQGDLELRRILTDAHLVVADGMPLVWASRWLGNPLPERVTGSGMTPLLLELAEARGWRVYFLGGAEESVAQAAAHTKAKHPRLNLVGAYSPPFKPLVEMDHADVLQRIRDAKPDLMLVAFGCPKQEKWLNMHYRAAGVPVSIGVGATIDFLAGAMKRAPLWMQRTGLEWVFRLLQEPRRLLRRYVTDIWVFGRAILRQVKSLRARDAGPAGQPGPQIEPLPGSTCVRATLPARFTRASVEPSIWRELAGRPEHVLLEARGLECVDSTGMAVLVQLQREVREAARQLVLLAPSRALQDALALMKLEEFFTTAPDAETALSLIARRCAETAVAAPNPAADYSTPAIVWRGEITAANIGEVASQTEGLVASAVGEVVIDLTAVRFIDSSGIGLMIRLRKLARANNTVVRFTGAGESVRNVARLLRLEQTLFPPAS